MIYTRARLRCLAALGLPALATSMFACSSGGNGGSGATPTVTVGETAGGTAGTGETGPSGATGAATAGPTASATTSSETGGAEAKTWVPNDARPQAAGSPSSSAPMRMPRCPSGLVCTVAGDSAKGGAAAPAPYTRCSAEIELPNMGPGRMQKRTSFEPLTTAQERKKEPNACCYEWFQPCKGGRPFRGGDGEILAEAVGRGDWVAEIGSLGVVAEMGSRERERAAKHYEREAAFEHASIAAFARASMGLLGLGAPPSLVRETHAAAMDEVEHAKVAFALASAFAGEPRGPSRLEVGSQREWPASLGELLLETFVDACVGETVAALGLREAAASCGDAVIGGLLSGIAEDEERHSELAWRTVAWALGAGGAGARRALETAVEAVRREAMGGRELAPSGDELALSELALSGSAVAHSGEGREDELDLQACGILGEEALREVRRRAIREVVLPCAEALLAHSHRGHRGLTEDLPFSET